MTASVLGRDLFVIRVPIGCREITFKVGVICQFDVRACAPTSDPDHFSALWTSLWAWCQRSLWSHAFASNASPRGVERVDNVPIVVCISVEARDVDGRHGAIGGHGADGRQLLQPRQAALRREGVRGARQKGVRAV